jgi:DNA-binding transcriptional LysR family regulator
MDEKDWHMLIIINVEKSITRAANRLYLSQPALTYRLDNLEKEMNTPLFIRSTKGIRFTSAGQRLVTFAEKMLHQYDDIKKYITADADSVSGTLRLGCSAVFAHNQLPLLLKEFHQKYPLIDMALHAALSNDILKKIRKEEIDIAIIRGDHPWKEADILLQNESLCIISATPVAIDDLPYIPSICYYTDPTMQYQIDRWWQENFSVPPKVLMNVDSVYTCRQLAIAGLGWAIIPALRVPEHVEDLFIEKIRNKKNETYKRPTRLIYRNTARELDEVSVFIDFICDKFGVST